MYGDFNTLESMKDSGGCGMSELIRFQDVQAKTGSKRK